MVILGLFESVWSLKIVMVYPPKSGVAVEPIILFTCTKFALMSLVNAFLDTTNEKVPALRSESLIGASRCGTI